MADMSAAEFYQRVLPDEGKYAILCLPLKNGVVEPHTKGFNLYYDTRLEVEQHSRIKAGQNNSVYVALASFKEQKKRTKLNALHMRSIFLDVDCGKGKVIPNQTEASLFIEKFINDNNLPRPLIVMSGRGFHVYWTFDRDIPIDEWQEAADLLKSRIPSVMFDDGSLDKDGNPRGERATGLSDLTVTADAARVLRAPGMQNWRNGKLARSVVDTDCGPYKFEDILQILRDSPPLTNTLSAGSTAGGVTTVSHVLPPLNITNIPAHAKNRKGIDFGVMIEYPPANRDMIVAKCQQIKDMVDFQDSVLEPEWHLALGVATFTVDPEVTGVMWSDQYTKGKGFNHQEMLNKMTAWKNNVTGPATCKAFQKLRPKGCDGCPLLGKITTPASIGKTFEEVGADATAPVTFTAGMDVPPWPFKRTDKGGVVGIVRTIDGTDIEVTNCDIYPVSYGFDEDAGQEVSRFIWNRPHKGWVNIVVPTSSLASSQGNTFDRLLAEQGIVSTGKGNRENIHMFMRKYMEQLKERKGMIDSRRSMGWSKDFKQFLLGNTMISVDEKGVVSKTPVAHGLHVDTFITDMYHTKGSQVYWSKMISLMDEYDMNEQLHVMTTSVSSPLWELSQLSGIVLNHHGKTGAGKSISLYAAQAMWGNPEGLRGGSNTTINALYARLGTTNNLVVTIDELGRLPIEVRGDILYQVSEGIDRPRLDSNGVQRPRITWSLPVCSASNPPVAASLEGYGDTTKAKALRVFDVLSRKHPQFQKGSATGRNIAALFKDNYGWGEKLIEYIFELGVDEVQRRVDKAHTDLADEFGFEFRDDERWWETMIALNNLVIKLAADCGLFTINRHKQIWHQLSKVVPQRGTLEDMTVEPIDNLTEYLNEYSFAAITMFNVVSTGSETPNHQRMPRGEVRIRFEMSKPTPTGNLDKGVVWVEKAHFRQWCAKRDLNPKDIFDAIQLAGATVKAHNGRATLGKGTDIKSGQVAVFGVSMHIAEFQEMLDAQNAAFNQLTVVPLVAPPATP